MQPHADAKTNLPSKNGTEPPPVDSPSEPTVGSDGTVTWNIEGITYKLDKVPKKNKRCSISVKPTDSDDPKRRLTDNVNLFSFRTAKLFAGHVADVLGRDRDCLLGHVSVLIDWIERRTLVEKKPETIVLDAKRRAAAEKLLARRDLLERVVKALGDLGYVGEVRSKMILYLIATSRLLDDPLSAVLRAPPGTGKSELVEKVACLMPDESVVSLTRLTGGSLWYLGPDALKNKLIVVDEHVGVAEVEHSLRVLQSSGKLTLARVTGSKTETLTVNGPVAVLSGTATDTMHEENASRVIEVALDDSEEQTTLVLDAQRRAASGESRPEVDVQVFQDAQRLLEPVGYVIPFAQQLEFPTGSVQARRDQPKLLKLVGVHAFLHQFQRGRDDEGRVVATIADYEAIFDLVRPIIQATLDGLSSRATTLYRALLESEVGKKEFTRRQVSSLLGWPYMTAVRALNELIAHELVSFATGGEKPAKYKLIDKSVLGSALSLTPPKKLR